MAKNKCLLCKRIVFFVNWLRTDRYIYVSIDVGSAFSSDSVICYCNVGWQVLSASGINACSPGKWSCHMSDIDRECWRGRLFSALGTGRCGGVQRAWHQCGRPSVTRKDLGLFFPSCLWKCRTHRGWISMHIYWLWIDTCFGKVLWLIASI